VWRTALVAGITVLYPFAVFFSQGRVEPRVLAALLAVVALVRLGASAGTLSRVWFVGALVLIALVLRNNDELPLKLYPVLVNAGLLGLFGWSVYAPPTVIERLARWREPDLPPAAIAYTRRVTQVWCGFFLVNGLIALYTAVRATAAVWSLYNGVIAYAAMGLLFAVEYSVRQRVMRGARG
jgi:uncharacterized membrane protein